MMYNSTPHSSTGKTPSELFFGRLFRDKIPSVIDIGNTNIDGEIRDRDRVVKEKGKEYADRKRGAIETSLEPGDKVYVKNLTPNNKTCPNFNSKPHTIISRSGGDVQVRNDETGQDYRRNIIHLKKVEGEWRIAENNEHTEVDNSNVAEPNSVKESSIKQ